MIPTKLDIWIWGVVGLLSLLFILFLIGLGIRTFIVEHVPTYTEYNYFPELQEPHATQR